ncbi:MAG: sugar ABC transporter permease [Shinella sp.]|uniref:carbohydrate ABC transporter permease n=1 Tax=Shinella sp. TaxID=1870904 RepID=UPI003C70A46B
MKKHRRDGLWPLILPPFALLAAVTVLPIVFTFVISLYFVDPTSPNPAQFQGFANYFALFSDERFINSLVVMAQLIVFPVVLQVLIGLALAIVLKEKLLGTRWMRLVFILPAVIPPAVSGLLWKLFIIPGAGGLTYMGSLAGVDLQPDLLNLPLPALIVVITASVWVGTPFVALLFLSALETVGSEQYEAATIDGASWLQSHWHISIPAIRPVITTVVVFRILEALAIFPIIFILTGGGPAGATEPVNYYAYVTGFDYLKIDYAATLIFFFFMIMMSFCAPFLVRIARSARGATA